MASILLPLLLVGHIAFSIFLASADGDDPSSYRGANLLFYSSQTSHTLAILPRSNVTPAKTSTSVASLPGGFAEVCSLFVPPSSAGRLGSCSTTTATDTQQRRVFLIRPSSALSLEVWGNTWNVAPSNTSIGTLPTFDVMYNLPFRECAEICPLDSDVDTSLESPYGRLAPPAASSRGKPIPPACDGGPYLEVESDPTSMFLPWFPAGCKRELIFAPAVGDVSIGNLLLQVSGYRTVLGEVASTCLSPNLPRDATSTGNTNCTAPWANGRMLETRYYCPTFPSFAAPLHVQVGATTTTYRPFKAPFVDPTEVTAGLPDVVGIAPFSLADAIGNSTNAVLSGALGLSASSHGCQSDRSAALVDYSAGLIVISPTQEQLAVALRTVCNSSVTTNCLASSLYGESGLMLRKAPLTTRSIFPQFEASEKIVQFIVFQLPTQALESTPVVWTSTPGFGISDLLLPGLVLPSFIATVSLCEGLRTISEIVNVPNGWLESQSAEVFFGGSSVPFGLGLDRRFVQSLTGWTNLTCEALSLNESISQSIALATHMGYHNIADQMRSLQSANPNLQLTSSSEYQALLAPLLFPHAQPLVCFMPATDSASPFPSLFVSPEVPGESTDDLENILFSVGMSATDRVTYYTIYKGYRMITLRLSQLQLSNFDSSGRRAILIHSLEPEELSGKRLRPKIILGSQILRNHWIVKDASNGATGFAEKPLALQVVTSSSALSIGGASDAFGGCVAPVECKDEDVFVAFRNKCLDPSCSVVFREYDDEGLQCVTSWGPTLLLFGLMFGVVMLEGVFQCLMTSLYRRMGRAHDNRLVTVDKQ